MIPRPRRPALSRVRAAALAAAFSLAATIPTGVADASDPSLAAYSSDTDRLFWFIHITDTHIGWPVTSVPHLELVAGEGYKTITPSFILITGDIVDAGFMKPYWDSYKKVLAAAGHTDKTIFDVPGNHDSWLDKGLSNFLKYSIQGKATGARHNSWVFSFPFGDYQIVSLDSSQAKLPGSELTFAETALAAQPGARLSFLAVHHPLSDADPSGALQKSMAKHKVVSYIYGHEHGQHSGSRSWTKDSALLWISGTLGKPILPSDDVEFSIFAVDNDGLSVRAVALKREGAVGKLQWPVVQITAPLDARLGGTNPWAYAVSGKATNNPIRALVFSKDPVTKVTARVDSDAAFALKQVKGPLWSGTFDGTAYAAAVPHTLSVTAESGGKKDTHKIHFGMTLSTACSDGKDNDGDTHTDYPADPGCTGLFDTDERDPPGATPDAGPDLGRDAGSEAGGLDAAADQAPAPDSGISADADAGGDPDPGAAGCDCAAVPGAPDLTSLAGALIFGLLVLGRRRGPLS